MATFISNEDYKKQHDGNNGYYGNINIEKHPVHNL
jgi:hypothetical protein